MLHLPLKLSHIVHLSTRSDLMTDLMLCTLPQIDGLGFGSCPGLVGSSHMLCPAVRLSVRLVSSPLLTCSESLVVEVFASPRDAGSNPALIRKRVSWRIEFTLFQTKYLENLLCPVSLFYTYLGTSWTRSTEDRGYPMESVEIEAGKMWIKFRDELNPIM